MSHPLLRTLISEMVESYLEESYGDDLIESIFDEVSEETWEAIEEAILNELSPGLLDRYRKAAWKDAGKHYRKVDTAKTDSATDRHYKQGDKRMKGYETATSKAGLKPNRTYSSSGSNLPNTKVKAR